MREAGAAYWGLAQSARAKQEGADRMPSYEALLRSTGSADAVARDAIGVDLEEPYFWHASLDLIESQLEESLTCTEA